MAQRPSLTSLFLSFFKLGLIAFGGPATVVYIREMAVIRHKWLDEEKFEDGLTLCQAIPGATSMQTVAYVGLMARGIIGALVSFISFGLPSFILMLILSALYVKYHSVPRVISLFNGLQVLVVAIVANATYIFARSTFKNYRGVFLAIAASIFFWAGISPFIVILCAAFIGFIFLNDRNVAVFTSAIETKTENYGFKQLAIIFLVLFLLLFVLYLVDRKLLNLAILMMRIDLFAFGGGFASVPLMLHEIVAVRGWMDSKTFMDGIALGEVTPGPILITSTFVGYMLYGLSGAIVATVSTFTPSFIMVALTVPVLHRLKTSAHFNGATKGILASFVGLLFFMSLKFAIAIPWDIFRTLMLVAVCVALIKKIDIFYVVLFSAVISVLIF